MANDNETVREVCAEMDDRDCECGNGWLNHYSTRVIAAYERDEVSHMAYVAKECAKVKAECDRELAAKDAEIARLKAALEPVMECDIRVDSDIAIANAVREAQRVMREGGAE